MQERNRSNGEQGQSRCADVAAARSGATAAAAVAKAAAAGELLPPVDACVAWIASVVHRNTFLSLTNAIYRNASRYSLDARSGVPAIAQENSGSSAFASGSASSTSELIVSQARIPPAAESPAQASIAMWNPSVIFAGS